ncbi:MAG: tripartite tricarboxylate transporter substrate binding protein [Pigmentiphaga sp.]|uniref:Bug family tripartite tricarboxylate transporter substrate binding protein n=1 Tax=Pigmentiphaga sp. TaxID=1977564 RepID=UPI0029B1851C|nr:tripartite tricarboxylate transporter substrate binding protein [Pigmentiphaga sp.]MDX3907149.1 tripartite tricarboxylate transporter substrate binding protein [Pigmentiphaga sp.]
MSKAVWIAWVVLAGMAGQDDASAADARSWPSRPIRLVVPSAPGSGFDGIGRSLADRLGARLGQRVVVENRPGATGLIGGEVVAKAPADGHTLLFTFTTALVANTFLQPQMPHSVNDFTAISQFGGGGVYLLVSADLPVHDLREFVDYVKKRPDELDYGSWGNGSGGHIVMESLKMQTGIAIRHIPYKSIPPILVDMQAGRLKVGLADGSSSLPLIRARKMRAFAVSGSRRGMATPEVPTMNEQGVRFDADVWYGVFGPAGMPADIVRRLNRELNGILRGPEMMERFRTLNLSEPRAGTPEEFAQTIQADLKTWGDVIKAAGITLE